MNYDMRIYFGIVATLCLFIQCGNRVCYDENGCKLWDGWETAELQYKNPATDYTANYTLQVYVEDCHVVNIKFPKDGNLDTDHFEAPELENDGSCVIEDEAGRTYSIQLVE